MLVSIVYGMPNLMLGIVIISILVLVAFVGLQIVRKFTNNESRLLNNDMVGSIGQNAGVIYAIVIGFVAVSVWQTYAKAGAVVESEANNAFDIWTDARVYPASFEMQIRSGVEDYLNIVIDEEWPLQSQGKLCPKADKALETLYRLIIDYPPQTDAQKIVHQEMISKVNSLFESRRTRLFINNHGLETSIYYQTIISSFVVLGFAWAFGSKFPRGHTTIVCVLGLAIGLVIFLIVTFDRPFRGEVSINADSLRAILEHMKRLTIEQPVTSGA